MSGRHKLFIFAVKVLVLIIITAPLWAVVAPWYSQALAAAADKVAPSSIAFRAENSSILIEAVHGQARVVLTVHGLSLIYGLAVLLALIIATPGLAVRKRLKFVAAAFVIMFIIHWMAMLAMGELAQSISPEHPSVAGNPLYILVVSIGVDLFPILVWIVLSHKYWLPAFNEGVGPSPDKRSWRLLSRGEPTQRGSNRSSWGSSYGD
jgi:glucan phosphoethanolaminetransferase (alkaline phosphatase superfamily)